MSKSIHDRLVADGARRDKALADRIADQAGKRQRDRDAYDAKIIRSDGVKAKAIIEKYRLEDEAALQPYQVTIDPSVDPADIESIDDRIAEGMARAAAKRRRAEEIAWATEALDRLDSFEAAEEARREADETLDDLDASGLDSLDARFRAGALRSAAQASKLTAEDRLKALTIEADGSDASEYETEEWIASIRRIGAAGGEIAERFFAKYPEERKWLI